MPKKTRANQSDSPLEQLSPEAQALIDFWRDLVNGKMLLAGSNGKPAEVIVPLDVRLRASENLAKYLMPKQAVSNDTPPVTAGILELARKLEERASPEEVEELIRSLDGENNDP